MLNLQNRSKISDDDLLVFVERNYTSAQLVALLGMPVADLLSEDEWLYTQVVNGLLTNKITKEIEKDQQRS